ncbi:MAG: class I SAM-dependent methyltransferase [Persephonella sp.]|nr:class I SAM-dependent methyltransferase [Persephonella sp.]
MQFSAERAEDVNLQSDIVVSRAAGETFTVLKWAKNTVKKGGYIIIMKGKQVEEELRPFTVSLKMYGLPERKFILIQKN